MKINDLARKLGIKNKDLITYLTEAGFDGVVSHMQVATDDMVEMATKHFSELVKTVEKAPETVSKPDAEEEVVAPPTKTPPKPRRTFKPDDMILCKSVTPWKLNALSADRARVYHWEFWGTEEMVAYKDLQNWRRKDIIMKPEILIEDADLVYEWRNDIGNIYKPFIGVDYPEQLFTISDDEFEKMLRTGTDMVREIIKTTAVSMIKVENYPSVGKVKLIDEITGTNIMSMLQ